MRRRVAGSLIIIWTASLFLTLSLSEVCAKNLSNTQSIEELSDLGSVREVLNVTSPVSFVISAWEALEANDVEAVLELTNDCIDRFGKRAQQMQQDLKGYETGSDATIRSYWALNDVATALFIQGKALENARRHNEAKEAYKELVTKYSYGQCWDPNGWFWKPAEEAVENIAMIDNGVFFDFGDYTSSTLMKKAWKALEKEDVGLALGYVDKCIKLYGPRALQMQAALDDYPESSNDEVFSYWALNDVATAHFIKARVYMIEGKDSEMIREFQTIRDELSYGQCWDPRGWWWKPAAEANNWLNILDKKK